eukprot:COSAG01_NODE_10483_length_2155_cov_4.951362_4_plen_50_part_00
MYWWGLEAMPAPPGHNNNNDALSQTWVIATVAVLTVRTVPYVEPHNVQG